MLSEAVKGIFEDLEENTKNLLNYTPITKRTNKSLDA